MPRPPLETRKVLTLLTWRGFEMGLSGLLEICQLTS